MEAVAEGRRASIDVAAWDANKAKLMYSLIKEQATQNPSMIDTLGSSAARPVGGAHI